MSQRRSAPRYTFSLLARCEATGRLAAAVASSTLAIGARCPHVAPGRAAVISQGHTNPRLGPLAVDLLGCGLTAAEVVDALRQHDRWIDYRQFAIVTAVGEIVGFTGERTLAISDQVGGPGFICLGNGLASEATLPTIAAAMAEDRETKLEARLLNALEQGRDHVCQQETPPLSASLLGAAPDQRSRTDLRVDVAGTRSSVGGDAVADLRVLFARYAPLIGYYEQWPDNPELGDWRAWTRRRPEASPPGPRPARRPS